jgi:hypothetical protein
MAEVKKTAETAVVPGITLPTGIVGAVTKSPKNLVIFSKPKVGKTTLLSQLPNSLLIDLEDGSDYVAAVKIKITTIQDLFNLEQAIINAGKPYKYIAIDTISALENMCVSYAEFLYSKSPMGANWFTPTTGGKAKHGNILNMANGAGYPWLRQAFEDIVKRFKALCPHLILLGHVKDTMLEKNGNSFEALDLNLTGKLKIFTTSKADAIGYLVRKGNKNILSFKTQDDILCGARPEHLRNKEIVISEIAEDGKVTTYWDQIFID